MVTDPRAGTLVRVCGTIDGHEFAASFMALGDGMHKLGIKAESRQRIGKQPGDTVTVHLTECVEKAAS